MAYEFLGSTRGEALSPGASEPRGPVKRPLIESRPRPALAPQDTSYQTLDYRGAAPDLVNAEPSPSSSSPADSVSSSWAVSPSQTPRFRRWTDDAWLWETITAAIGLASIVSIALVLFSYNNAVVPQWGTIFNTQITLNSVISILGTVARATLVVPILQCIGQLKWIHYHAAVRPLSDFAVFDDASRSAIGAMRLFSRFRERGMIQQPSDAARAVAPSSYASSSALPCLRPLQDNEQCDPDREMTEAITDAILGWNSTSPPQLSSISPACPSGNCTWPQYSSLAICAATADVTPNLTVTFGEDMYSYQWGTQLPKGINDGQVIMFQGHAPTNHTYQYDYYIKLFEPLVWTDNGMMGAGLLNYTLTEEQTLMPSQTLAFPYIMNPILHTFVYFASGPLTTRANTGGISAFEMVLYWCAQTYTTSVSNGVTKTTSSNATFYSGFSANGTVNDTNAVLTAHPKESGKPPLTLSMSDHARLQDYFNPLADGTTCVQPPTGNGTNNGAIIACNQSDGGLEGIGARDGGPGGSGATDLNVFLGAALCPRANCTLPGAGARLNQALDTLTVSMTNVIRRNAPASDTVPGFSFTPQTFVRVQWAWLAMPLILAVLAVSFLITTVLRARRSPIHLWKTSGLAALQALPVVLQADLGPLRPAGVLATQAQKVGVRLRREESGWRLAPEKVLVEKNF